MCIYLKPIYNNYMKKIILPFLVAITVSTLPIASVSCYNKNQHTEIENFEMFVRKMPKTLKANDLINEYDKKRFIKQIEKYYIQFDKYSFFNYDNDEFSWPYNGFLSYFSPDNDSNSSTSKMKKLGKKYLTDFDIKDYYLKVRFIVLNKWQNSKKSLEYLFRQHLGYINEWNSLDEKEFKEWTKFINVDNLKKCKSYKLKDKIYIKNLLINVRLLGQQHKKIKDYLIYVDLES